MKSDSKIYVAGHNGLAGSAIVRRLRRSGFNNIVTRSHADLDLIDGDSVRKFFREERPEFVFLAAARVGGILANATQPVEFLSENLAIELNVIREAFAVGVQRLLFLGSSCIYPRDCPQPIREEYLLTGPLEETNRAYALAKIAGVELCRAYNKQHGTQYLAAMPTNLYGPGDNFDLEASHVLPALVRKIVAATVEGAKEVVVWGTGKPRREFLHSDDMADACVLLMNLPDAEFVQLCSTGSAAPLINVGCGTDITIADLAQLIASTANFNGKIVFDPTRPDGTPRKLLDISRLSSLGWKPAVKLSEGIAQVVSAYAANAHR